jgi:hypothetical protein
MTNGIRQDDEVLARIKQLVWAEQFTREGR